MGRARNDNITVCNRIPGAIHVSEIGTVDMENLLAKVVITKENVDLMLERIEYLKALALS